MQNRQFIELVTEIKKACLEAANKCGANHYKEIICALNAVKDELEIDLAFTMTSKKTYDELRERGHNIPEKRQQ